jgi:hypothetical protein
MHASGLRNGPSDDGQTWTDTVRLFAQIIHSKEWSEFGTYRHRPSEIVGQFDSQRVPIGFHHVLNATRTKVVVSKGRRQRGRIV